jgi:hypothetical protein
MKKALLALLLCAISWPAFAQTVTPTLPPSPTPHRGPLPAITPTPTPSPKVSPTPIPLITPTPSPLVSPSVPPVPPGQRPPVVAGMTVFMNKSQVSATFKVQTSTDQVNWKDLVSVPFTTTPPIQYYRAVVDFSVNPSPTPASSPTPAPGLTKTAIELGWDAATCQDCEVAGYKIWDAVEYSDEWKSTDVGNVTSALVANLDPNLTYSFYATAYDTLNRESGPSNTILFRENPVAW